MEIPVDRNNEKISGFTKKYLEQGSSFYLQDFKSEEEFQNLLLLEESLVSELYNASFSFDEVYSDSKYSSFREELDLAKANLLMKEGNLDSLPDFLYRYTQANLDKPVRENCLIVRLSHRGIQVLDSISLGLSLKPNMALSPELRSAVAESPQTNNDSGFVVFEEKVQGGQKFFYQMVRETDEEIFLSVKIDDEKALKNYRQVNLRKDGRFVISTKINSEGIANFSGLREGSYSVEFLSESNNKTIDLYLILD